MGTYVTLFRKNGILFLDNIHIWLDIVSSRTKGKIMNTGHKTVIYVQIPTLNVNFLIYLLNA